MRFVSFEHNGQAGVGVMAGDDGFVDLAAAAPDLPVTLREILESVEGWQEKIAAAVDGPFSEDCPASLLQDHPDCTFIVDRDAASKLSN